MILMGKSEKEDESIETLSGQECPMCRGKTLTLMQQEKDIPFFGKMFLFSMTCNKCKYHKYQTPHKNTGRKRFCFSDIHVQ